MSTKYKTEKDIYTSRQGYKDRRGKGTDTYAPLDVKIATIDTTLLLLDSEEDMVLISVFKHITEFMLKQDANVVMFREKDMLDLLLEKGFFIDSTNTLIKRFALYDADLIIESMNTLTDLETKKTQRIMNLSLGFYLLETDDFCLEYLTVIINKCCDDPQVARSITTNDEFLDKFYNIISTTSNPDILLHAFEALHKMLQVQSTEDMKFATLHLLFPMDRILCDITNEYLEIRSAALRLVKLLIVDTGETSPFAAKERFIFVLSQLTKVFCTDSMMENMNEVIDVLATALRTERMTKVFFERNFFDQIVQHLKSREERFPMSTRCQILAIFAETAKFTQFLYRLHVANITNMFLNCVLAMENITDPPAAHVIMGLNRSMKFPDAAQQIVNAYSSNLLVKLMKIITSAEAPIKTREQAGELVDSLLIYAFVNTADELLELDLPKLLAEVLAEPFEQLSIDFVLSLLTIIETLAQNEDYRAALAAELTLSESLALLLKNTFATAVLTAKLFRCLCTLIEEAPVREQLLLFYLSSSIKRGLKSLSNSVKTAVTNFIMQTTRFPEYLQEYINAGVLEVLILHQKYAHCVATWAPAIDSILSKSPSLKFCIRNHLGFTDNTAGQDFHVSKKKFEDFRDFQNILREEVSPLHPIYIVNFNRLQDPTDMIIVVPPSHFLANEARGELETKWCYCRKPGDDALPRYLDELNMSLERNGMRIDAAHARRCIDFDNLAKRVKIVAALVATVLSENLENLDLNSPHECSEHVVRCHLKELCIALHCSILPLGKVHSGCMFERAVLFKCLADQIGLPATLQRSVDGRLLFNEVPLPVEIEHDIHCDDNTMKLMPWRMLRPTHIVDLMFNVGELYPLQSRQALQYLRLF